MQVRVTLVGVRLPGRVFHDPAGGEYDNVHVGVQIRREPADLVPGDAHEARWDVGIDVVLDAGGEIDFRGPAVQGRRGERFVYLTWGSVDALGHFHMFRRAKLMLDRIDAHLVRHAIDRGQLTARIDLTDSRGGPRCARVDPPAIEWSVD
jgi:Family of unknown function (DUF5990)